MTAAHTNGHAAANGHAEAYPASGYPRFQSDARYKKLPQLEGRLKSFVGGYYAKNNLSSLLVAHRHDDEAHVKLESWSAPGHSKPLWAEAVKQVYKPAKKGQDFGPDWSNHWFKVTVHIPKQYADYELVYLEFDSTGEAMVFDEEGNPYHGLTGGTNVDRRAEFIIPEAHRKAGVGHYWIEASCNGMFGVHDDMFGEMEGDDEMHEKKWVLKFADLVVPNQEAVRLKWDFEFLRQLGSQLPEDSALAQTANFTANEMMNVFRKNDLESVAATRKVAENTLGKDWQARIIKDSDEVEAQQGTLWAIGHCHIDTAWLWPFSVTQQKSARSWSAQCDLMDRYPEYVFSATQPQQFKWVEQLYPTLFTRILEKVKTGRFQPLGCTWVEMDTNMPSGEALVRQFLYGQRYFEKRFGKRSSTFVLPDTFGYSSQLPQICRLAGAPNFFTQKISWNNINSFPHSTFNWAGLDGSQVLTHMTPVESYNSQADVEEIRRAITRHKNLDATKHALLIFGNGDGGGGPTAPMLEKVRRTRAVVNNRPDAAGILPLIKNGGSFEEFYDAVRAETKNGSTLPIWHGELYLEIHRATYTSQAMVKKGNRKSENLLREAEYAATLATLADKSYAYPKERLDAAWEDLLLCQFHDVLPGSSIDMVYDDAEEIYAKLHRTITAVIEEAYAVVYAGTRALEAGDKAADIVVVNTLPGVAREEVIKVGDEYVLVSADGTDDIGKPAQFEGAGATAKQVAEDEYELANSSVKVTIKGGRITSIVDVQLKKELIPEGQSAGLIIYEDQPNYWDAWDVDYFHVEKSQHLKFDTVSVGSAKGLRASLLVSTTYDKSHIEFEISLDAVAASVNADARSLIRVDATADWRQKHEFLKFELPLDIHNDVATYDTQFGVLTRPTHRNTSWDAAKFEVCAHKFADLSEFGYGVALLNDCKYGYATAGNVVTLSLLRGPRMPDPDTDMGAHAFSFGIYPHVGTFAESDVPHVAAAFNNPLKVRAGASSARTPITVTGARNVVLETIKRGEDNADKTIIVRLYEQFGGKANATLRLHGLKVSKAEVVNLLEDHVEDLEIVGGDAIALPFRGFEIKSVRLTL
ncbi:Alpha-mannosidase [Vanrija pseudolonga]|uniref:Alpha-mannosidase n=1 Tax=Vanrija pseudolonga TaxID=143232 RepID=A0AAF1BHB0_9TREE|nr:Alpha-mannosidase [Vanrija pseudolonga]